MPTLTIASFTIQNFHRPGTTARLKVWFGQDFVTAEDQFVMGGAVRSGSIYLDVECTLDSVTHILTLPDFSLPTTNDSSVRNVRATAVLFDASGAFVRNLFTGWIIPSQLEPQTTFADLNDYNAASALPPNPTYPSTDQILSLINNAIAGLGNTSGDLTAGRVPRAATEDTLVDSQIEDNGSTIKINTLNSVEIGDINENQNGSYISIDDTAGRVSFQAGGDGNAQYAGISAVAGVSQSEFYIQGSHGNGYNYGSFKNGIAKLGDGEEENNGTQIVIDDVAELIMLHNLPTSDPGVANAIWKSGLDLKISQGQPSESASPSVSESASPSASPSPSSSPSASPSASPSSSPSASPSASESASPSASPSSSESASPSSSESASPSAS